MKLLIITQKVDKNDPILGFFHRWIEEFAKHCEKVTVICLGKGEYNLPENVKVLSLGKEEKLGRLIYLYRFYKYIYQERKNYDMVFVHMNQEYVLLGGLIWRFLGKKILFWRNHAKGDFLTRLAIYLSNRVFCTSPQSFTARFKKTKLMPVGIDTDFFQPNSSVSKKPNSVIFLGRIAPVKNVDIFIEALNELQKLDVQFTATIVGGALPVDTDYEKAIKTKVINYGLDKKVQFVGPMNQDGTLKLYQEHELYVNLTPAGSLDKTIFEAMACGLVSLVYNQYLCKILGEELVTQELETQNVAQKIEKAFALPEKNKDKFRNFVIENHGLKCLINKIIYD